MMRRLNRLWRRSGRAQAPAAGRGVPDRRLAMDADSSRGTQVSVLVNGVSRTAYSSEMVAGVLLAEHVDTFRTALDGSPRAVFCGMGVCFDCLVVIDGHPNQRACVTRVREGMRIETQQGLGPGFAEGSGAHA